MITLPTKPSHRRWLGIGALFIIASIYGAAHPQPKPEPAFASSNEIADAAAAEHDQIVGTVLTTRIKSWACANLSDAQELHLLRWNRRSSFVGAYNAARTPGCVFFDPGQSLIITEAKRLDDGFKYVCVRPTGSNQACYWNGLLPEDEAKIRRFHDDQTKKKVDAKFKQEHPLGTPHRVFSQNQIEYMDQHRSQHDQHFRCMMIENRSPKECLGVD
jgi:hypothetical protein